MNATDHILNFPTDFKIDCLKAALAEGKIDIFNGLAKVLLDAPISKGGISTEVIEAIHVEHLENLKTKS